jgi:pimeloyl-ACP methyl ester carboxylesterase
MWCVFHITEHTMLERVERNFRGSRLSSLEGGEGQSLLFLHAGEGPAAFSDKYLYALTRDFHVVAPWHPGFGDSTRPANFRDVHDLAYFYLDLAEHLGLSNYVLAGASVGGWIALEMAVRNSSNIAAMVLVGPVGIKVGDRETRDYVDMFAVSGPDWLATLFQDPKAWTRDFASMSDEELLALARSRESMAYYSWQPYMHDPQLVHWLHRIKTRTLIARGENDRVVRDVVHEEMQKRIPCSEFALIPNAGHYAHVEQPEAVAAAIVQFARGKQRTPNVVA